MPTFPFGDLAPDRSDLDEGMVDVRNALPGPSGYIPFKEFQAASINSLSARPRGAIQQRDKNGDVYQYAGDATKLYQNVSGTWTDKSKVGGYTLGTTDYWEFAAWKNKVLATSYTDNPQTIDFGGAIFADLTSALKARHIAVVRDFVVLANTTDATDGAVPSRVRWSAINDETSWAVSPTTLSGYQDLKINKVERVFGGEYGVIFQNDRTWRMSFVGSPQVWQFDEVLPGIGIIAPGGGAQDGDIIYFLSSKGFFALNQGTQARPIGDGRIDEFVRADLDLGNIHRMSTVVDPNSHRVYWAYPGANATAGRPNRMAVYDPARDRWSLIDDDIELVWSSGGTGRDLDAAGIATDPDLLDDPPTEVSFDDPRWVGGAPFVGAFDETFASGSFSGETRQAELKTKEYRLTDGGRTQLNGFRALVQGGTVTAKVGTRNHLADDVTYSSTLTARSEGRFTTRQNARYHRFWFTLTGDWQHAIGMEIGSNDLRSGGLRG